MSPVEQMREACAALVENAAEAGTDLPSLADQAPRLHEIAAAIRALPPVQEPKTPEEWRDHLRALPKAPVVACEWEPMLHPEPTQEKWVRLAAGPEGTHATIMATVIGPIFFGGKRTPEWWATTTTAVGDQSAFRRSTLAKAMEEADSQLAACGVLLCGGVP